MAQLWAVFQNFHGGPEENWLNLRWYPGCSGNSAPSPPEYKEGMLVNEACLCNVN